MHKRLKEVDQIEESGDDVNRKRWAELFRGVLAGNIFDSGATAVQDILNENHNFGLHDALQKIQSRPWLIDSFDQFMIRLEEVNFYPIIRWPYIISIMFQGPTHNCAAFFCDNSGVDIVLGVLPFVRELLKRHTKVILCANSEPSLNDVTYLELVDIVKQAAETCSIIKENFLSNNFIIRESGQKGCCLNLLNLDE